ncbi:hypothetical protein DTO10_06980 [Peribacillus butanolivorans]|uniref:Uncharacterized protein n=1 Tax=Peribacillus butanolivorans TaxID=421767 RepID=A0ABM6XID1_9BACI|nr:hypothetical protein DTO10_06980 [Peribacillus butanolivorans]
MSGFFKSRRLAKNNGGDTKGKNGYLEFSENYIDNKMTLLYIIYKLNLLLYNRRGNRDDEHV